MSYQCPKCSGVIYNRRLKTCGYCGAELPPELLFSPAELEVLDKNAAEHTAEQQKIRAKLDAEDLEAQNAASRQKAFVTGFVIGKISR